MKLEGYKPSPQEMTTAENLMTTEQRLATELREKFLYESIDTPEGVTEQQKEAVEKETDEVAKILNLYGKPWFIAGGTSLELAQGEITRNHQDTDIAMYYEDMADFFDYAQELGYKFVDTTGTEISTKEEVLNQRENAFVQKIDEAMPGPRGFEIMFLRRNEKGEIIFGGNESLTFPAALYENGKKFTTKNNQEVPLTPKEVQILYKIFDGRQKDFHDIKTFLPTLSQDERGRLNEYLEGTGATFVVGDRETQDLDELLQLAETTAVEAKENLLMTSINEAVSKYTERFDTTIAKMFEIAAITDTPESFLEAIKKEFSEEVLVRRKSELEKTYNYLSAEDKPSMDEFREFAYRIFKSKQYLEDEVSRMSLGSHRWQIRMKGKNVE